MNEMSSLLVLAVALMAGLMLSRVAKLMKLPAVTAYLVAGILIGPYCLGAFGISGLGFTSMEDVEAYSLLADVALGFIAFSIGNEFRLSHLKHTGRQATVIGIFQAVVATTGYTFKGWAAYNPSGSSHLFYEGSAPADGAVSATVTIPDGKWKLVPVFVPVDSNGNSAPKLYQVGEEQYYYFDDAVATAKNSGQQIVLINSGKMILTKGTSVEIPSGVTFVLPYAAGNTTVTSTEANKGFVKANYTAVSQSYSTNSAALSPESNVTFSLTVPSGITVVNKGNIVIGGTISSIQGIGGATAGPHSNLVLSQGSVLQMGDDSVLSACGYVLGTGEIIAKANGAAIYQVFTITDYRSGNYVVPVAGRLDSNYGLTNQPGGENAVMAFNRYSLRNIQTKITLGNKASVHGYCDLYTQTTDSHNCCTFPIAGASGLWVLTTDDSVLTMTYNASQVLTAGDYIGRNIFEFVGGASFESTSLYLSFNFMMEVSATIDTSKLFFVVPFNFQLVFSDGDYSINNPIRFLPGSELTVDSNATLTLKSKMVVYDHLFENVAYSQSADVSVTPNSGGLTPYPSGVKFFQTDNESANFIVNGTFIIDDGASFGGLIQTNPNETSRPVVKVASNATLNPTVRNGGVGSCSIMYIITVRLAGASLHTVEGKIYNSATGVIETMTAGCTYYGLADASTKANWYRYEFYGNSATPTKKTAGDLSQKNSLSGKYLGGWYTLPVHSTTDRTDGMKVDAEYRLQDYLWLNAICYFDSTFGTLTSGTISVCDAKTLAVINSYDCASKTMTENDGIQLVVYNGAVYIVKKIPSDEIPDTISFILTYTSGSTTYTSAPITIKLEDCKTGDKKTDALVDALIDYGEAAKKYFVTGGAPNEKLTLTLDEVCKSFNKTTGSSGSYNGVSLATKGASVLFEERLALMLGFEFSGEVAQSDVVQVGVLVGKKGFGTLTTENFGKAYILYGNANDATTENLPTLPSYDNYTVDAKSVVEWDALNADGRMILYMDLKSVEYTSAFELRPFAVMADGSVLYGAQYAYGLGDYINNMLSRTDAQLRAAIGTDKNVDAFRNLLVRTWEYALAADAKY